MTPKQSPEDLAQNLFPSRGESPNCSGHARTGFIAGYGLGFAAGRAEAEVLVDALEKAIPIMDDGRIAERFAIECGQLVAAYRASSKRGEG